MTKNNEFMKWVLETILTIFIGIGLVAVGLIGAIEHELFMEYLGVYGYILAFFLWIILVGFYLSSSKEEP